MTVAKPTIRKATQADSAAAAEVVKSVFLEFGFSWEPDGYNADVYDLDAHYLGNGGDFWVAELDGEIVATAGLHCYDPFPGGAGLLFYNGDHVHAAGADCEIGRVYVMPHARKLGLGKTLTQAVIEEARVRGKKLMEIWSDKSLTVAHGMYQRMGAKLVGERICHDPDQCHEWGFIYKL